MPAPNLHRLRPHSAVVCSFAIAALGVLTPVRDTRACGGFFARRSTTSTVTVPSLQVEQVLILHDAEKEQEHFIREIVFRDAKEPFGFVVPTPSQPTVAKVDKSPFAALAARFPPEPDPPLRLGAGGGMGSTGSGPGGSAARTVTVISQERIGSFTAFVLAANDASALKKWLADNQLASTPESEAWLRHYVDLGFYFVAFRYEVPDAKSGAPSSKSETVRISFSTPRPYYPYLEPDHANANAKHAGLPSRVLAVWLVSRGRSVPVAMVRDGNAVAWKRPWKEARRHGATTATSLTASLGTSLGGLLPRADADAGSESPLVVQTFEDQKITRRGWGDVVLVPEAPKAIDDAKMPRLEKLMAVLDDGLGGAR